MSTWAIRSAVMDWPAMATSMVPLWRAGMRESQAVETTSSSQPLASQMRWAIITS
ncbi:Uncharacterised protein [Flavonifractor plautii]|uniref:Uncharacterized protein n=1 Tax=Flavonifractor plautii TaxID=292800 RepID=A0A174SZA4_FLAPL|nr:Uncharacterised protein [Flavonifractor plautii]